MVSVQFCPIALADAVDAKYTARYLLALEIRSQPEKYPGSISEKTVERAYYQPVAADKALYIAEELGEPILTLLSSDNEDTKALRRALKMPLDGPPLQFGGGPLLRSEPSPAEQTNDDSDSENVAVLPDDRPSHPFRVWALGTATMVIVVVAIGIAVLRPSDPGSGSAVLEGNLTVLLASDINTRTAAEFTEGLRLGTPGSIDLEFGSAAIDETAQQAAQRLRRDGLVLIKVHANYATGRRALWEVRLGGARSGEDLWFFAVPRADQLDRARAIGVEVGAALRSHLEESGNLFARAGTPSRLAIDAYVEARNTLESGGGGSTPKMNQVHKALSLAIAQDPGFAHGHAALCEVLALMYWTDDLESHLAAADDACTEAVALQPDDPYVLAAVGQLSWRSGKPRDALARLQEAISDHPRNVDLRIAAAQAAYAAHTIGSIDQERGPSTGPTELDQAIEQVRTAIELEPDYWVPHFWLGTWLLLDGRRAEAIPPLQKAVELDRNELSLVNLGNVAFCLGKLDLAEETFLAIDTSFPASHLGPEFLAVVLHYRGRYAEEIRLRKRAIKLASSSGVPAIQQIHTSLAEAHLALGEVELAHVSFQHALSIIRDDELAGRAGATDIATRAYIELRLAQAGGALRPAEEERARAALGVATAGALDTYGHVMAAKGLSLLGETAAANAEWAAASDVCPVFRSHPQNPAYQPR